jgi:octopine/nopaline transport system substrate-binding protein
MIRILGFAAMAALAGASAAQAKDWQTVRIATEGAYPPWNMHTPDGKLVGFEIDLADHLCAHMKVTCQMIATDWDGVIPGLNAGKFDAIMDGMSITPKRLEVINFSIPYAQSGTTFAVDKSGDLTKLPDAGERLSLASDNKAAIAAIEALKTALKGKTIGVQVSTIQADFLNTYFKGIVTVRAYPTTAERDLDLKAGRLDAVLDSKAYLVPALAAPDDADLTLAGPSFGGGLFGIGSGVGLRKSDPELKVMFDAAIKSALDDGTIKTLSMKWFKFDLTPLAAAVPAG